MRIGRLDRRITFIQAIFATGTSNEDKITGWEEIDSSPEVWAQKIERSGDTSVLNDRVTLTRQTDWVIRFRTDIKVSPAMRLVYATQVFEIVNAGEIANEKADGKSRKRYTLVNTSILDNIYFT